MHDPAPRPAPPSQPGSGTAPELVVVRTDTRLGSADATALAQDTANTRAGIATPEVDRAQERVMTATSPEGRPPERRLRLAEWKWFFVGAGVLGIIGLMAAGLSGVAWPTLLLGGALVCLFLGAAVPTWGAGLLRGGEERAARKAAVLQTEHDRVDDDPAR